MFVKVDTVDILSSFINLAHLYRCILEMISRGVFGIHWSLVHRCNSLMYCYALIRISSINPMNFSSMNSDKTFCHVMICVFNLYSGVSVTLFINLLYNSFMLLCSEEKSVLLSYLNHCRKKFLASFKGM